MEHLVSKVFFKANFTLWVFVYHVIHFDHIYLPIPSTRIPPRSTPSPSPFKRHVFLFFSLWPTKSSLHQSCADWRMWGRPLGYSSPTRSPILRENWLPLVSDFQNSVPLCSLLLMPLSDPGDFFKLFIYLFVFLRQSLSM